MQRNALIIIISLVIATNAISQTLPSTDVHAPEKLPIAGKDHYVNDSTRYSLGNAFGQSWFNNQIYRVEQRNPAGNVLTASDYEYDTLGFFWYQQRRYQAQYINNTIRKFWLSSVYDKIGSQWLLADSIHFNSFGLPTIGWYKEWNPITQKFIDGKLSDYFYNDQGVIHLTFNQRYDSIHQGWLNDYYEVVYYNHFDLDSLRQYYSWSSAVNNWKDSLRITYTYNDKFFPKEEILETRAGNSWMNSIKWKFVFSNDLLDEEYEYYSFILPRSKPI